MEHKRALSVRPWCLLFGAIAWMATPACNSGAGAKSGEGSGDASNRSAAHIDVMCIGDLINDPKENFHYSYKYSDESTSVEKKADITPQTMDITVKDRSGSHSYHGARSDENSWNSAVLDLSNLNIAAMSARLNSLNGSSAIGQVGAEPTNGYQTTKYAIDTTSSNASDKHRFETLFGKGSFEKGTAWMSPDGCAAKLELDEGLWQQDGSIKKTHFEIARSKK